MGCKATLRRGRRKKQSCSYGSGHGPDKVGARRAVPLRESLLEMALAVGALGGEDAGDADEIVGYGDFGPGREGEEWADGGRV